MKCGVCGVEEAREPDRVCLCCQAGRPVNERAKPIDGPIVVLEMIAKDMAADAENFDGKEFNGKNVATYFGNHGAAIAALANIIKEHLLKEEATHD